MHSGVPGSHAPQDAARYLKDRIQKSYLDMDTLDALINPPTNKVCPRGFVIGCESVKLTMYVTVSIGEYWVSHDIFSLLRQLAYGTVCFVKLPVQRGRSHWLMCTERYWVQGSLFRQISVGWTRSNFPCISCARAWTVGSFQCPYLRLFSTVSFIFEIADAPVSIRLYTQRFPRLLFRPSATCSRRRWSTSIRSARTN